MHAYLFLNYRYCLFFYEFQLKVAINTKTIIFILFLFSIEKLFQSQFTVFWLLSITDIRDKKTTVDIKLSAHDAFLE